METKFDMFHSRSWFKNCSNWLYSSSSFRERSHFLTEIKPSELDSDISRIVWRRKLETIHSNCSNWLYSASWFRERSHLLTEIKPSQLNSGISKIVWRRKLETIHSRVGSIQFKRCLNWLYCASCFPEKHHCKRKMVHAELAENRTTYAL